MNKIKTNVAWGLKTGLTIALALAAIVTLQYVLRGPSPFEAVGMSYGSVLTIYLACGLVGGLLLGLMRPLYVSVAGGVAAGFVLGLLFYGTLFVSLGEGRSPTVLAVLSVACALLVGVPVGVYHVRAARKSGPP